jgi:hypothetical protein
MHFNLVCVLIGHRWHVDESSYGPAPVMECSRCHSREGISLDGPSYDPAVSTGNIHGEIVHPDVLPEDTTTPPGVPGD